MALAPWFAVLLLALWFQRAAPAAVVACEKEGDDGVCYSAGTAVSPGEVRWRTSRQADECSAIKEGLSTAALLQREYGRAVAAKEGDQLEEDDATKGREHENDVPTAEEDRIKEMGVPLVQTANHKADPNCPKTNGEVAYASCPPDYKLPDWASGPLKTECLEDQTFGNESGDLCRNEEKSNGRGVIMVHGSGSDKADIWSGQGGWGNVFLKAGFTVFSINYKTGSCENYINEASTWLRKKGHVPYHFRFPPENLAVFGYSIGAICAGRAAVYWPLAQNATIMYASGLKDGSLKALTEKAPALMIGQGDEDCTQPITFADNTYKAWVDMGVPAEYYPFPKGTMKTSHTQTARTYPCLKEYAVNFMEAHLQAPDPKQEEKNSNGKTGAPTAAPTPTPTPQPATKNKGAEKTPMPTPANPWVLALSNYRCKGGTGNAVADLAECKDLTESQGFQFFSYRAKTKKCIPGKECKRMKRDTWVIYSRSPDGL